MQVIPHKFNPRNIIYLVYEFITEKIFFDHGISIIIC